MILLSAILRTRAQEINFVTLIKREPVHDILNKETPNQWNVTAAGLLWGFSIIYSSS
jgi:hypothetical protein